MAPALDTISDGEKPESSNKMLDPQGEQSDFDHASTRAPSTAPDFDEKKRDTGGETDEERGDEVEDAPQEERAADPMDYPTGVRLTFIIVALVLSIFLVSLDMVSCRICTLSLDDRTDLR